METRLNLDCGAGGVVDITPVLVAAGRTWLATDPGAMISADANVITVTWANSDGTPGPSMTCVVTWANGAHRIETTVTAGAVDLHIESAGVRFGQQGNSRILIDGYHSWDWAGLRDATLPGEGWWGCIWGRPGQGRIAVALDDSPRHALRLRWSGRGELDALATGTPPQVKGRSGGATSLDLHLAASQRTSLDPIRLEDSSGIPSHGVGLPRSPDGHAPLPRVVGWGSWNCHGGWVSRSDILKAVALVPEGGLLLLDDGWMPAWGDWETRNEFGQPSGTGVGLGDLARTLASQRRGMGAWLAPFLVDPKSTFVRHHEDLLLRDPQGKLVVDNRSARRRYVLDASKPEVRDRLRSLGERLGRDGLVALKLDFLYAGASRGVRQAGVTDTQSLHDGVAAVVNGYRSTAPAQSRVFACGAPAPPVVGLVDACRSGDDSVQMVPSRGTLPVPGYVHGAAIDGAQLRNLAARSWLWYGTLPPDVDAISLGRLGMMPATSNKTMERTLEMAWRAGGPLLDSDHASRLSPKRRDQLRRVQARVAGTAPMPSRPRDPLQGTPVPMEQDIFLTTKQRLLPIRLPVHWME